MRALRPFLRLGGWVVVVTAAIVGLMAFLMAGNPDAKESAIAWIIAAGAFLASGGMYWMLARTAREVDDPGAKYQPSSVLAEMAVPLLTKLNERSRPFTRGGIGIVTFGVWMAAVVVIATVWAVFAILLGLLIFLGSRAFEALGMAVPDPVVWLAGLSVLVVPIAATILVIQWARRRPAIRYWLR